MGLVDDWECIGATTLRASGGDGSAGEAGSSGGPTIPGRNWPTLVAAASVSQTLSGLHDVMRWSFAASDHEVKIVLLLKLDKVKIAS